MKKPATHICFGLPFLFFFLSLFILSKTAPHQETSQTETKKIEPMSEYAKQWLEEVVPYIINSVEKEIFVNLPNEEERGKFIENFWRKRDPEPKTPENEFKLDYYRRIAMANKFFGHGGIQGWRTDRGRIYIILGPPNEIQRDMSPTSSYGSAFHGPRETWNYWGLSNPKLPYNVEFVFVDKLGTENYVLEQSLQLAQGGSTAFDLDASHYFFDYLEILTEATRNPFEGLEKLKGVITTQVTYDRIPIEYALYRMKGPEDKTYVPVIVQIPSAALTPKTVESENFRSVTLMIIVSNHLGQIISERSKDFNFKLVPADLDPAVHNMHQLQMVLALESDAEKIHLLVLDNFSGKIGTRHEEISLAPFGGDLLSMSDIILSSKREIVQEEPVAKERELASQITSIFKVGEEMDVLVEVYNLSLDAASGVHSLSAEYLFLEGEKVLARIPSPQKAPTSEKDVRIQTSFKLKNFEPGDYRLRIKAIDLLSGKEALKEIQFRVIP